MAGVGISMCLPTVPTVAVGSVAPSPMGVASGANSAVRQLGGVFGVAILAGVFNAASAFTDRDVFVARSPPCGSAPVSIPTARPQPG